MKINGLNLFNCKNLYPSLWIADHFLSNPVLSIAQVSTTLDIYTHAFDKNRKKTSEELYKGLGV